MAGSPGITDSNAQNPFENFQQGQSQAQFKMAGAQPAGGSKMAAKKGISQGKAAASKSDAIARRIANLKKM